ncbi:hypothetical protein ACIKTA_08630 [Hansschlegelia beijingensis]
MRRHAPQPNERILFGDLGELPALAGRADVDGPVLILIGRALAQARPADADVLAPRSRDATEAA